MNLLIIGAGFYQHYIYTVAKDLGFTVFSVDGNPDAPMFEKADDYEVIDIYDVNAIVDYARRSKIDLVGTINIDQPMSIVSQIQNELGLPHKNISDIMASTRKDLMRLKWSELGLNNPKFWVFDATNYDNIFELVANLDIPLFIKPVDNAAKRGIAKIDGTESLSQLKYKITNALSNSKLRKIIVEEYIDGDLFFVPTYIKTDGEVITSLIKQKVNENFVQIKYDAPVGISLEDKENIVNQAVKAAFCFGPGPYHTEILYSTNEKKAYLVETSPRISYATVALTRLIDKFDPVTQLLSDLSGKNFDPYYPLGLNDGYASLVHLQPTPGKIFNGINAFSFDESSNIYEVTAVVPKNHVVRPLITNVERVMYFVAYAKEKPELDRIINMAEQHLLQTCF